MKIKKLLTISLMLLTISGATFASLKEKMNKGKRIYSDKYNNWPLNEFEHLIPKKNSIWDEERKTFSKMISSILTKQSQAIKKLTYASLNIKSFFEKNTKLYTDPHYGTHLRYKTKNLLDIISNNDESKIDLTKIEDFHKRITEFRFENPKSKHSILINLKTGVIRGTEYNRKNFFKKIKIERQYRKFIFANIKYGIFKGKIKL